VRILSLKQFSKEELQQMSFIEVAHDLLVEKKSVVSFQGLLDEITRLLDVSESEARGRMVQFYTDLNIDGRFIALGDNRWGLREWYPVDQIEEETVPTMKAKKKKTKKAAKEEEELELDEFEDLDDEELDYDDLDDIEEEDLSDDDDEEDLDDEDFDDDEDDEDDEDLNLDDELDDDEDFDDDEEDEK
jgi:DNA-directed RNA polymerase subunit delta